MIDMIPIIPKPNHCTMQKGWFTIPKGGIASAIQTRIDETIAHPEGYTLEITESGIEMCAATAQGIFYAQQTLRQLQQGYRDRLPLFTIADQPAHGYRGFMLDCCRHFFPVEDLKKMIDAAACFKFNKFHWHLTDDQGWRIQIDSYPKLVEVGATRPGSNFGKTHEPGPYGGYYTKDDIREIVQYCKDRFIDVIPELEIPGHASAILAAYPELSCDGEPVEVKTSGGIFPDILCAGNPEIYPFLEAVLDEFMELFPYEMIHLGGDEAPKKNWRNCQRCQDLMQELALDSEHALQGHLTNTVAAYLEKCGKKVMVWNDSLKGGNILQSITIQHWMGNPEQSAAHANQGGDVVVSDYYHYYLDYSYGQTPLEKTYNYEPTFGDLTDEGAKHILGVECPVWTEYISDFKRMTYMAWPRMAAVAETGWTDREQRNYGGFEHRLQQLSGLFHSLRIQGAPPSDWNPKGVQKVSQLLSFWNNAITWDAAKQMISQLRDERGDG